MKTLYLMLSHTSTGVAKLIRLCTRYEYNHVSLSLDPELRNWVSFARLAVDVPLAGGFVQESPERLCGDGASPRVRIYRIAVPPERYAQLEAAFSLAGTGDPRLVYNFFSAMLTAFGHRCRISGAYTCLDFACLALGRDYPSIQALDSDLSPQLYYTGLLSTVAPDSGDRGDAFFRPRGFLCGTRDSTVHLFRLIRRCRCGMESDPLYGILK